MAGNPVTRAMARLGLWASEAPDAPPDVFDPRFWGQLSLAALAGQTVTAESALQLDVVQSVLGRLAGTISSLPMMVFERVGEDGRRPARDHPLFKILHRSPGFGKTAQEFRDEQERHLAFYRNCYARIWPDQATGAPIGELEVLHPGRLQEIRRNGRRTTYTFLRLPPQTGTDTYTADEIWHIRKAPLTQDGLMGQPVWQTGRETLGYAQAVRQFGALYFKNGGSGGGVLKVPGGFKSTDDRDAFLEGWRSGGSGLNRHKDRLLLFNGEFTPFEVKNDEAQFIESKREANVDVARLWNMPPHLVGILDRATFSNIEHQSIEYVVHTLAPDIAAWEQAAARDLLIGEDQDRYFVEINVAGLLRGDIKTRWTAFAQGRQWGWLSANDVRRFENMDPIARGGDIYLEPMNMNPAGLPKTDGQVVDPAAPEGGDDPADTSDDPGNPR